MVRLNLAVDSRSGLGGRLRLRGRHLRHEHRQPLHELQRAHHQVRRSVAPQGRGLQWPQRACPLTGSVGLNQTGLTHLLHRHAPARDQLHEPGDDGLQQRRKVVNRRTVRFVTIGDQ